MRLRIVLFPLFAALLAASILLVGLTASSTIGAGGLGAVAAKKKKKKKKKFAPISGRLSKRGYTLIALADNSKAATVRVKGLRFRLRPPAREVTLHLRAPDGSYAGPVVVGAVKGRKGAKSAKKKGRKARGKRMIVGVKDGARLGKVKLDRRRGYAKVAGMLGASSVSAKRWARATGKGVPIGNGRNLGLVRSKAHGPVSDRDLDGIPRALDVDDDGDLIVDALDHETTAEKQGASSQVGPLVGPPPYGQPPPNGNFISASTNLPTNLEHGAVNVDGGSSDQEIASVLQNNGQLHVGVINVDPGSAELDCGGPQGSAKPGLPYCSAGGTGRLQANLQSTRADSAPFPECCDPDHDGFGSFTQVETGSSNATAVAGGVQMSLLHGATQGQIHAGDVLIMHATAFGAPFQSATTVGFVPSTQPVVASYDDGQGDSGTFTYHGEGGGPPVRPVRAGLSGDVVVSIRFWRPQRPAIGGEPSQNGWIDVGKLWYLTHVSNGPGAGGQCPQSSYLGVDPSLALLTAPQSSVAGGAVFADSTGDQPSQPGNYPANSLTLTMDLTQCLAATGAPTAGGPYDLLINALYLNPEGGFAMSTSGIRLQPQP
jgi:hypothetical protein